MDAWNALRLLTEAQKIDPDMPLQQLMCLLVVSENPDGMSLTDLASAVGVTLASASRYVGALGKINRRKEEGLNFLEAFEDPLERRKKIIRLTPRGRTAVKKILGA
jgi:DNA-binding MarR family transcriptional regulator